MSDNNLAIGNNEQEIERTNINTNENNKCIINEKCVINENKIRNENENNNQNKNTFRKCITNMIMDYG